MTTPDVRAQDGATQNCFLCVLDPHPCAETQIEGRIVAARERKLNGETVGYITLDSGTSFVSLALTRHYRSLVKGLLALGSNIGSFNLTLRVYHLPNAPDISTYKDRPLCPYSTYSY